MPEEDEAETIDAAAKGEKREKRVVKESKIKFAARLAPKPKCPHNFEVVTRQILSTRGVCV